MSETTREPLARLLLLNMSPASAEAVRDMLASFIPGVECQVVDVDMDDREGTLGLFSRADVVLGDYTFVNGITAEMARAARRLLLIQQTSVGYQHIDIDACREAGIPVANTAGANAIGAAEHAILLILALMKKLIYAHARTASGFWGQAEMFDMNLRELCGKTLGIVGMGHIGRELAKRARCFDCRMLYADPRRLEQAEEEALGLEYSSLDELLAASDVVSLHLPLTPETRNIIGRREFSLMRDGALLINLARGEVVDQEALTEALETGKLGGAGLDVFAAEPIDPADPVLRLDNVVLSPHIAGTTDESRLRMMQSTFENIRRVAMGERPLNVVNGVG